ncbi:MULTISPECIES: CinA family protein [Acinetobacter Taxon 24D]|uniref:CinA family protein n=1 Tax=Acinetobacter Taxon 24D TaxID=2839057 RepID=UPI00148F736A|nr:MULTISPECIES: CinA family protein [Acinetobacter Taxon 24D]NNG82297.1 damage-inducible protein CinA [Acinetobacter sp. ANC 5378]NNG99772.1 damage-inducible protein CinA [Acinetobacter sp. ANC 5414]
MSITKCCKLIAKNKLNITFIESASAGYLAYRFSFGPFSGEILNGGLVCYDLKIKENVLKIPSRMIKKYTPESSKITEELVKKSKKIFKSDIYVGCTGLLKQGGSETKDKPVGTFFYSVLYNNKIYSYRCFCKGEKEEKLKKLINYISKSLIKIIQNN